MEDGRMIALVDYFIDEANTGKIITFKGEQYTVSNVVIAHDNNVLRAHFLLVSVQNINKFFDFEVSAQLYDSLPKLLEK